MEIEVFKTNIKKKNDARQIIQKLNSLFPELKVNFDLDDCDKILRVEGGNISVDQITYFICQIGFQCNPL